MNIHEAMFERRSIRSFSSENVPVDIIKKCLNAARRAPSWKNAQPYEVHIVTGARLKTLSERFFDAIKKEQTENPDEAYQDSWPVLIKKRMFQLGMDLYSHLKIDRKDKDARKKMALENFSFFGAPMALFFFTEKNMKFWPQFDAGIFYGYVTLALMEEGLSSCPQATLVAFPDIVRDELSLPPEKKLLVGMSVGYASNSPVNTFHTERAPEDEILFFHS